MMKAVRNILSASAAVLLVAGTVQAQNVTIGPITATGTAGQEVDFDISYTGPTDANGVSFNMTYDTPQMAAFIPIFSGTSTTKVKCTTASDLDPGIVTSAVLLTAQKKIGFTVIGLSLDTGPIPFGRTGTLGTCKFTATATASGTIPLPCDTSAGATTASNAAGDLPATCVDGSLSFGVTTQVQIGPITATGTAGQPVNFDISFNGPTTANGISFNMIYGAAQMAAFTPIFSGTSTTKVKCTTAADLDPGITTSAVVLSSGKIGFTVIGLSLDTGPIPFGRTGTLGTCQFTVPSAAAAGVVPLPCDTSAGATTASDANGDLTASCANGTLTISGGNPATPTNTPTVQQPTNTPTVRAPTATATLKAPTATVPAASGTPFTDEDGCQIGTHGSRNGAWLLLIPAIGLLITRRRR